MSNKRKNSITMVTTAAMMTAISVVIGIFCKTYLNFGMGLFRVTFENLPIIITGIIYGPIVGAIVGAASDLVSYLFSAQAYPPNLIVTLGAMTVGIVAGTVSKFIVRKKGNSQIIISGAFAHIVGSMIIKPIGLYQFYGILVLWRIPLYLIIAPIEIFVICVLLKRRSFARLIGYFSEDKNELR